MVTLSLADMLYLMMLELSEASDDCRYSPAAQVAIVALRRDIDRLRVLLPPSQLEERMLQWILDQSRGR